jgi:hypothetical protein
VNILERLRRPPKARSSLSEIERALRERFAFLEQQQGFELVRSEPLPDGARVAYKNVPAGQAIVVFARAARGVWAGIGPLDSAGRLRPVNREAIEIGEWRALGAIDIASVETLNDAIESLALALGGNRG